MTDDDYSMSVFVEAFPMEVPNEVERRRVQMRDIILLGLKREPEQVNIFTLKDARGRVEEG
jgi:hypothetical protein